MTPLDCGVRCEVSRYSAKIAPSFRFAPAPSTAIAVTGAIIAAESAAVSPDMMVAPLVRPTR